MSDNCANCGAPVRDEYGSWTQWKCGRDTVARNSYEWACERIAAMQAVVEAAEAWRDAERPHDGEDFDLWQAIDEYRGVNA